MSILNLNTPQGRGPAGKKSVKLWMGVGLLAAVLGFGSTLAANININQDENTEFGQGVTRTVYCGVSNEEEESITVTPLSKFVNESVYRREVSPARSAQNEVAYEYRFAKSGPDGITSDFIISAQATKSFNGRTGVWLTDSGSSGQIASNQNESTFSSSDRDKYVFSQDATTRSGSRGFYKVKEVTKTRVVISAAIASRSAQYVDETTPSDFYFSGVVISDIPENCEGKNFIISGYPRNGGALTLINNGSPITEITALWTGDDNIAPKVSSSRNRLVDISSILEQEFQDEERLEIVFGCSNCTNYAKTDELYRLVIETQEDTLSQRQDDNDD